MGEPAEDAFEAFESHVLAACPVHRTAAEGHHAESCVTCDHIRREMHRVREEAHARGTMGARQAYAQAWADGSGESIEAVVFTTGFVRERAKAMAEYEQQDVTATITWLPDAYDGPGWYYFETEYPEEGYVGAFVTAAEALKHASEVYDFVLTDPDGIEAAIAAMVGLAPRDGCTSCGWRGLWDWQEDRCPECNATGTMTTYYGEAERRESDLSSAERRILGFDF